MENNIQLEVLKLQEELVSLDNAVKHIEKAGKISNETIQAIREIQARYGEHQQKLLDSYNEYLKKSHTHSTKQINELKATHQNHIDEIKKITDEYHEFVQNTEKRSSENFDIGINRYNQTLNHALDAIKQQIEEITNSHNAQIERVSDLLETYQQFVIDTEKRSQKQLDDGLDRYNEYLNKAFENNQLQIDALTAQHQEQILEVKQLINQFMELALQASGLTEKIEGVDFPSRLDEITKHTLLLNEGTQNTRKSLQQMETATNEKLNVQNQEINARILKTENHLQDKMSQEFSELNQHNERQDKQIEFLKLLMYILIAITIGTAILIAVS